MRQCTGLESAAIFPPHDFDIIPSRAQRFDGVIDQLNGVIVAVIQYLNFVFAIRVVDCANGFDHTDGAVISGDGVRQKVTWNNGHSMDEFSGKVVRLEIFLQDADLFTVVAE